MTAWLLSKRFGSFSCACFRSYSVVFFQLWALAMKITVVSYREEGNWLKRSFQKVFPELINLLMLLEIQISSTANICEQTTNFYYKSRECFLELLFFSEIMLESFGCGLYTSAAYTWVFTVHVNFEKYQKRKLTSIPLFVHSQVNPRFQWGNQQTDFKELKIARKLSRAALCCTITTLICGLTSLLQLSCILL